MNAKIIKYVLFDIVRSRMVLAYALFLFTVSLGLFFLEANPSKTMLSLLNIVLIVTPLVSIVFATIHFYNSYEFIELLAAQPLKRSRIILSEYAGLTLALLFVFWLGVGLPTLAFQGSESGFALILAGSAITMIFVALAVLSSVFTRDKARGIGAALMMWFFFTLIYDGIVLFFLFASSDYPVEKLLPALSALNPIDLGRIFVLLKMDHSAMMGFTGAVFKETLGTHTGSIVSLFVLFLWAALPLWWAVRIFEKKDL